MFRTSISVDVETVIDRPPVSVWDFVSQPERLPEWLGEFVSVSRRSTDPVGVGSVFAYTLSGGRSSTLELVEWVPGRRLAWDGPPLSWLGGAARPRGFYEIRERNPGSTLFVSSYTPELFDSMALLRWPLRRWLQRQRSSDTQRLKHLLEHT